MQLPRKQKEYKPRKVQSIDTYGSLFRFHVENVAWMLEYFLRENTETTGGALSNRQGMEVFLRHVGDPGFQDLGVGEDMGIHQSTVSRTFATVVEAIVAKGDT